MRRFAVLAALAVPTVALADWPLGTKIEDGLLVDVTEDGFGLVEGLISDFIPAGALPVPPVAQSGSYGCLFGFCAASYEFDLSGVLVNVGVDQFAITPGSGELNLAADATIDINSTSSPAILYIRAELAEIEIIDDTCDLWIDPIHLDINGTIGMELDPDPYGVDLDGDGNPDTKILDATVPALDWNWDADGDDIHFDNCGVADVINTINDVTAFFGFDLYELILDQIEPLLDDLVTELPAEIEPLLEDTFADFTISEELDLLGVPLSLTLWPDSIVIQPDGMRIGMGTVVDVPVDGCVAPYGIDASLATPGSPPGIGQVTGLPFTPHLEALIDDDWINHLLFGVWSGGLLCYDLSSASSAELGLPLPIDTGLLALLAPGVFDPLFPETAPMAMRTAPRNPPIVDPQGSHDVDVVVEDLGLGFFADIDGRTTRLMNIDLDVTAGIDLSFDPTVGTLGIGVDMGEGAIVPGVTYNEFVPSASAQIESSFGGLFDALVGPLLGGLLADTSFAIPSFEGIGVLNLEAQSVGANGDFIGAFVEAGTVPYYAVGCDSSKGCDTSGCSSGCSTGTAPAFAVFAVPLLVAGLRRRR